MTTISVGKLGPSTAMIPIASRMKGNASWASASVMIIVSVQPPRKPARRPSVAPTIPPTTTAAKPTSSETRAPWIIRERTSRPRWSVPSTCALPSAAESVGAASRARSDWRTGSCGAITGAAIAVMTTSRTNTPPPSAIRRVRRPRLGRTAAAGSPSARADAGIEEAIDQVDAEVDHDEEYGGQEHRALHDGVVAVVDRLDREPSDARPRKHRFRHDGAAEQRAELQPGDGDDRDGRVLQRVLGDDQRLGQALGAGGPDVVRAQHFEHRRPGEPGDRGHGEGAERERGQEEIPPVLPAGGRQEAELQRDDQDQENPDEERRRGLADERQSHGDLVDRGVAPNRRDHADGQGDERREDERRQAELECRRQVAEYHAKGGLAKVDRPAEVPAENVAEEDNVLHRQGTVEAELGADAEDLAARGVGRQEQRHGIARQAHDHEDDGRDEPERDRRAEESGAEEREEPAHRRGGGTRQAPPPEAGLRAAELEVEAADLELLQRVRRPLHVLLEPVVLVRLDHRNPRKVLQGDLGHLPVRVGAELLVDREAGSVAELVELGMTPVVLRATGTEQAPHHAVGVAQRGRRIRPPHALEALVAVLLGAHGILEELDLGVDPGVAPHGLNGLGHGPVARHVARGGFDDDLLVLVAGLAQTLPGFLWIVGEGRQRSVEVIVALGDGAAGNDASPSPQLLDDGLPVDGQC